MALFDKKEDKDMQTSIKILATNLEILNQKLNQDPNAAISPGEKAIKDSIADMTTELEYVKNVLKSTQSDISGAFKDEKAAMQKQIGEMNRVSEALTKLDKQWLKALMTEMEKLNKNANELDETIIAHKNDMYKILDTQRAAITKSIYHKLFKSLKKDNLIMMGFSSLLSSTIALIVLMTIMFLIK